MAKTEITLTLDADLLAKAQAAGVDLSSVLETAVSRRLAAPGGADVRWAEENALMLEALAGGAEEVKP